jgi:hypothetical protein
MKKKAMFLAWVLLLAVVLCSCTSNSETGSDNITVIDPGRTWVALLEMNEYPDGYSDFSIDYINSKRMKDAFTQLGVKEDHILTVNDKLDYNRIKDALEWLNTNSKDGDTIILYTFAHGSWLRRNGWNSTIAPKWLDIKNRNKLIFVASCNAGEFLSKFINGEDAGIAMGAATADEIAWAGTEEEGLPIIGEIFTYYFTKAVFDKQADVNNDGYITDREAYALAATNTQSYMKEKVFAVDEFLESYHKLGAFPEKLDTYPNPVYNSSYENQVVLNKLK